jgi:hypothetical protein
MKTFTQSDFPKSSRTFFSALLFTILLIPVISFSQRVELTPFGGYLLGGSAEFYEGKFKVWNAPSYGGNLAFQAREGVLVELNYTRTDTRGDWQPYSEYFNEFPKDTIDLAMNYLQVASVKEVILDNESVRPYGLFSIGTSWINPKTEEGENEWLFVVSLAGGVKYFFSDKIGIRLQARLLLPMIFNGGGFYFGVGTGGASSGWGVTSTSPIVQGDFTGGLVFVLGN